MASVHFGGKYDITTGKSEHIKVDCGSEERAKVRDVGQATGYTPTYEYVPEAGAHDEHQYTFPNDARVVEETAKRLGECQYSPGVIDMMKHRQVAK